MRTGRTEERQGRKAAQREAEARKKRRTALIWGGIAVVIVLAGIAFAYRSYSRQQFLNTLTKATYPAAMHVAGPISYKESPPIGGPHNVLWQNCGIYEVPIHNEHAVHSLEHGAVWITYRPDLPADQVAMLKTIASDDYMLLSPYPGLDGPIVATSWNHQLRLADAADPRLARFIGQLKNNPDTTPEFGASCYGGTSAPATADTLTNPSQGIAR